MSLTFQQKRTMLLVFVAALAGVALALWIETSSQKKSGTVADESNSELVISEIVLAKLTDPLKAKDPKPPLKQELSYTTLDQLALRVTTQPHITSPIQMNARLLTSNGGIMELEPPSMTLPPGESTFCCWTIPKEGKYTLQLFRPERIISSIPIEIRKGEERPENSFF